MSMTTVQLVLEQCWGVSAAFAPWLLLGLLVAGLLHVLLPADLVRRHLGGPGFMSVLKASLLGVPMPLCSCSVIPAAVGLKKDGATDGAAVAFLVSTPQTGLDCIAVSTAFLGFPFALFMVFSTFLTGVVAGWLVDITTPVVPPGAAAAAPARERNSSPTWTGKMRELLRFSFGVVMNDIWAWVALGIAVSAVISVFFPPNSLAQYAWTQGFMGMFAVLAISIPLYVCATGSVPIAAALVAAGLPPGSALVFLMAGPATNAATLGAVYRTFGKRVVGIYLAVIVSASLLLGSCFNFLVSSGTATSDPLCHLDQDTGSSFWAAALLLMLTGYAVRAIHTWWRRHRAATPVAPDAACPHCATPEAILLHVAGMTCEHCASRVKDALAAAPGVTAVTPDVPHGTVRVHGAELDVPSLCRRLAQAGFVSRLLSR